MPRIKLMNDMRIFFSHNFSYGRMPVCGDDGVPFVPKLCRHAACLCYVSSSMFMCLFTVCLCLSVYVSVHCLFTVCLCSLSMCLFTVDVIAHDSTFVFVHSTYSCHLSLSFDCVVLCQCCMSWLCVFSFWRCYAPWHSVVALCCFTLSLARANVS